MNQDARKEYELKTKEQKFKI